MRCQLKETNGMLRFTRQLPRGHSSLAARIRRYFPRKRVAIGLSRLVLPTTGAICGARPDRKGPRRQHTLTRTTKDDCFKTGQGRACGFLRSLPWSVIEDERKYAGFAV